MFMGLNSTLKRDLNELKNAELADLGAEFTEEGERALTILQNRQQELIMLYRKAYSETERKNYPLAVDHLNNYISLADKYGDVVMRAVFDLLIWIARDRGDADAVLSLYDDAIGYYTGVDKAEIAERFKQGKEHYK